MQKAKNSKAPTSSRTVRDLNVGQFTGSRISGRLEHLFWSQVLVPSMESYTAHEKYHVRPSEAFALGATLTDYRTGALPVISTGSGSTCSVWDCKGQRTRMQQHRLVRINSLHPHSFTDGRRRNKSCVVVRRLSRESKSASCS